MSKPGAAIIHICLLALVTLSSCQLNTNDASVDAAHKTPPIKALYLTPGQAELSSEDLQAHPEVVVVHTFDEFKKYTSQKTALWIDKSVTPLNAEQEKWINEAPQA